MLNGFTSSCMYSSGSTAYFWNSISKTKKDSNWGAALEIEGVEDAYEISGNLSQQTLINNLLTTFLSSITPLNTWSSDPWNDDIGWMCIVMIRGYQMTGNTAFLNAAESGFNMAFARGWSSAANGGGIWEEQGVSSPNKNSLSNNSLGKAAAMIYLSTGDTTYYNKAKQIYDWVWHHLYDSSTGLVYTYIAPDGTVNKGAAVYNQGTFADFANLMYEAGAGSTYLNDAKKALNYAISNETNGGIFSNSASYLSTWADDFARALGHVCGYTPSLWSTYYPFMANQCNAIWSHRLQSSNGVTYNITWNGWAAQTPFNTTATSMWYVSAVAMEQFTPAAQPPTSIAGTHSLINKFSKLALDNPNSSPSNGTDMDQWTYNGGANQKWTFNANSDGTYTIVNQSSGKVLDDPGSATAQGTPVEQWTSNGGANQHWIVTPNQDETYTIVNMASNLVLEDPGFSTANGTVIDQWESNDGPNQRWFLH